MVLHHFHLREQPFGVTPDPRYLYAGGTHREALASLLYGVESGLGFVTLTANPGMGKTTLLFEALRRFQDTAKTVFLFQTIATPLDLVRALLIDLGVKDTQGTLVELQTQLNEVLVNQAATGKRLIVVIDEAQNLDETVLEAVRMLSNFETARQKLLQIVLAGQLQLKEKLALPQLLQLRQRISIFAHLEPLTPSETAAYIQHRLRIAGHNPEETIFTSSAMNLIARESRGIPRNINNICFNSLTLACALQRKTIDVETVAEVLADLDIESTIYSQAVPVRKVSESARAAKAVASDRPKLWKTRSVVILAVLCVFLPLLVWLIWQDYRALTSEGATGTETSPPPAVRVTSVIASQVEASPASNTVPKVETEESSQAPLSVPGDSHRVRLVPVRPGQSLFSICEETFGECRPELFREIIKINQSITDPNHIVSGQKVAIPAPLENSANSQ